MTWKPPAAWARLQRFLGLTLTGWGVLLAGALALWWGNVSGNAALVVIGVAALALVVAVRLLLRRRPALEADRQDLPRRLVAGAKVQGGFKIRAQRRTPAAVIVETIAPELGDSLRVAVGQFTVDQPFTQSYGLHARRRGRYSVGPLLAEMTDPFGLVRTRCEIAPRTEVIVHPPTDRVLDRVTARQLEDPPIRPPRVTAWPTGNEFYGMRDYQPGDDPRRIVWRALAAHDRYVVREAERGVVDQVLVVLDTFRHNYHSEEAFDEAVSAAASAALSHLANGFSVTFVVGTTTVVASARGTGQRLRLLDACADVTLNDVGLEDTLGRIISTQQHTGHMVLVTPTFDDEATARVQMLCSRGRSMTLALVWDNGFDDVCATLAGSMGIPVVEVGGGVALKRSFEQAAKVHRS